MKFQLFCVFGFSVMLLFGICLSDDTAFISMKDDCRYPAVATEGNDIYLAWLAKEKRPSHVYFRRSVDEGNSWSGIRKLSNEDGDCMPPSIAAISGTLHLTWVDCSEVIEGELHYTRSLDGGITWEKNTVIVDNINSATNPMISGRGNNVYLIWQDVGTRVFFKASRDNGLTWERETLLGDVGKHSCYCYPPALSVNGDTLIVIWNDLSSSQKGRKAKTFRLKADTSKWISSIVCRKSNDNGRTWSRERILTSKQVSKETTGEVDNPTLFTDGLHTWLFWQDKHKIPLGEILYTGISPKTKKRHITGKPLYPVSKRSPKCPSAVFDNSGNLHLAWTSFFRGMSIVHYGVIDPSGNMLKGKTDLSTNDRRYQNPVIARTPSGLMHIFWFNKSEDKNEPSGIFLKTSKDNGLTWENRISQFEEIEK